MKTPCPDQKLYHSIIEEGFSVYPERKRNYEKFKQAGRNDTINYMPVKLDVEPTTRCNFKCNICLSKIWTANKKRKDLSFLDFKHIIDSQYGLIELKLQGLGEPLLNKDFFKMVEYAREKYIWVRTTTNASLLHVDKNYKKIIDSDISELQVSIDGASKEIYERVRRGGSFEQLQKNCILLNDYAKKINKERTRMWVVLQKENLYELFDFLYLAKKLGFSRLTFSAVAEELGAGDYSLKNNCPDYYNYYKINDFLSLVEEGIKLKIEVTFWGIDRAKYNFTSEESICQWPFYRFYISADGYIVPCCKICIPDYVNFGKYEDFEEVWFGKEFQEFRKGHLNGVLPAFCKPCYI